jgi:hypothetical protein
MDVDKKGIILKKMDVGNCNRGKAELLEEKPVPVPRTDAH